MVVCLFASAHLLTGAGGKKQHHGVSRVLKFHEWDTRAVVVVGGGAGGVVVVVVPFISETDGGDSEAKVWVGFLHEDLHNFVRPGSSNNPEHLDFLDNEGRNFVPGAHSLVSVANEQFGFFSMDEEDEEQEPELEAVQEPAAEEVASAAKAESRIAALEEDMKKIRDAIAALPAQLAGNQQKHQAAPTAAVLPPRPREEAAPLMVWILGCWLQHARPEFLKLSFANLQGWWLNNLEWQISLEALRSEPTFCLRARMKRMKSRLLKQKVEAALQVLSRKLCFNSPSWFL